MALEKFDAKRTHRAPHPTPGNESTRAISHPDERRAIALLHRAGWKYSQLTMVFEISNPALERILDDVDLDGGGETDGN